MSERPRLLDCFCGAGGATRGYQLAGFHVTGVDVKPQPYYVGDVFYQADALEFLEEHGREFDAIHASPPCQYFTQMRASWRAQGVNDKYTDLLTPTRDALSMYEVPWVIENVIGAGKAMRATVCLHGNMFGLRVDRARLFESNVMILAPKMPRTKEPIGVYDNRPRGKTHHRTRTCMATGKKSEMRIARTLEEAQEAMGMDWADWHGTKEAIPPAYTQYIGGFLMAAIEEAKAS